MRITDRLLVDKVLGNIQLNESRLARIQDQVSTGRRISAPSDDPTGWQYNGDNGDIQRAVAPGVKLGVNVTGDRVFPQVFDVLIGIRDDLRNRFQQSLSEDRLDELDSVHDDILNALGEVGAKGSRLDVTARQLSAQHLNDSGLISQTEDVDMSEAIIHLSAQQAALQASLATGA